MPGVRDGDVGHGLNNYQMLFQTLKTMLTTCTEPLTECLSPEDVEQMRKSTEETQKKFLVKILDGKVTEEEANRCGGVKHKHKHKYKYKYKYRCGVLKEKGGPPISPVSSQKMPIPPVGQSGTKMPIPPIEGKYPTLKVSTKRTNLKSFHPKVVLL